MRRFKPAGQARGFLSAHDGTGNLFHLYRRQAPATRHRTARTQAFQVRAEVAGVAVDAPSVIHGELPDRSPAG